MFQIPLIRLLNVFLALTFQVDQVDIPVGKYSKQETQGESHALVFLYHVSWYFLFNWILDRLTVSYSRSSGPGGQHVNKGWGHKNLYFGDWSVLNLLFYAVFFVMTSEFTVSTKAEVRFHVLTAEWIPEDVRHKIFEKVCFHMLWRINIWIWPTPKYYCVCLQF